MFKFLESRDPATIALKVEGKVTEEDALKMDQHVKETFGDDTPFNMLAIFDKLDGSSLKGLTKGTKFDAKRWDQFRKFAIISDKKWLEVSTKVGNYLPGVTAEHFDSSQLEQAWDWIKQ
ncbi:STAS/SEC14 domain-containing protein [Thalassobacillus devorans]|uniref:STAS/SEC14 domain-containing protein n=1 Tax=Thalassobacillus devorans TaxID=279813 RepID=UPI000A1CD9BA|nr:STAS/SEC14 domain-containing protein [Thalassobacillus devorans]